jgi:hypothetical protein
MERGSQKSVWHAEHRVPSPTNPSAATPTSERAEIWQRSRLRDLLWDVDDLSYSEVLLATIFLPTKLLTNGISEIHSHGILPTIPIPLLCLTTSFPSGLAVSHGRKKIARGHTT